jgi:hypothetical protein
MKVRIHGQQFATEITTDTRKGGQQPRQATGTQVIVGKASVAEAVDCQRMA